MAAFVNLGYLPCADPAHDAELEKVALFLLAGVVKHAARQLRDGWWTSKMGRNEDMRHRLRAIEGPVYGEAAVFLARRWS